MARRGPSRKRSGAPAGGRGAAPSGLPAGVRGPSRSRATPGPHPAAARPQPTEPLPAPLRVAVGLALLQAVGLVALGLLYAVRGALGDPESRAGALLGGVLIAAAGVLLALAARALARRATWARSPVLVVQLLGLLTAFSLAQGGLWGPAAVLGLLSAALLGCLLSRSARAALDR